MFAASRPISVYGGQRSGWAQVGRCNEPERSARVVAASGMDMAISVRCVRAQHAVARFIRATMHAMCMVIESSLLGSRAELPARSPLCAFGGRLMVKERRPTPGLFDILGPLRDRVFSEALIIAKCSTQQRHLARSVGTSRRSGKGTQPAPPSLLGAGNPVLRKSIKHSVLSPRRSEVFFGQSSVW